MVVKQAAEPHAVEQVRAEALKFLQSSRKSWRRLRGQQFKLFEIKHIHNVSSIHILRVIILWR